MEDRLRAGAWEFPVGSKLIKTFAFQQKNGSMLRTETRFEIREASGWNYYSYRWNEAQTEAFLLSGAAEWTFKYNDTSLKWHYPSRSQCAACHTKATGRVMGWHTGQINKAGPLGNQLYVFNQMGMLSNIQVNPPVYPAPSDLTFSVNSRARASLFANCAGCHMPGGDPTTQLDLRFETPLSQTKTCNVQPDKGSLGISGAKLIAPGVPSKSVLLSRMKTLGPDRMPNLGSYVVDTEATALIQKWIQGLSSCNP